MSDKKKSLAKPFLKWAGGKRQLIKSIDCSLPEFVRHGEDFVYVEPFIGSGAVMFWFLQKFSFVNKAIINDINTDLIDAYNIIKKDPLELIRELENLRNKYCSIKENHGQQEFYLQVREKFNARNSGLLQKTALLIFLNRTCFNGLYRVNSKGKFNVPFGKYVNPKICDAGNIMSVSKVLQKVIILNGDYSDTFRHIPKKRKAFFYFDPPYKPLSQSSSFNSYASQGFGDTEQERLKDFCLKLDRSGCHWLLSNSDLKNTEPENEYFDELYKDFTISRVKAIRKINSDALKRGEIYELLISNYPF